MKMYKSKKNINISLSLRFLSFQGKHKNLSLIKGRKLGLDQKAANFCQNASARFPWLGLRKIIQKNMIKHPLKRMYSSGIVVTDGQE